MSAPKRARDDESAGAAAAAGGAPPARRRPATRSVVAAEAYEYERRLKLTDVIGFVALNGYAREANACAGLNRETWRCIPAGLSAADAGRVRRDHQLWQAIIDLPHGKKKQTRLGITARTGRATCVHELLRWHADTAADASSGGTPLWEASYSGHLAIVRKLLAYGANVNSATICGSTPLIMSSWRGHVAVVRTLLAAGADKRHLQNNGATAASVAGTYASAPPGSRAAILALLAAAP